MAEPTWFDPPHQYRLAHIEAADRERQHAIYQATVDEVTARRLVEFSGAYPNLAPGVVTAAAASDASLTEPGFAELEIQTIEENADIFRAMGQDRNPIEWGYDILRGTVRTATLGFDTLWQELIERPLRAGMAMNRGYGIGEAWDLAGDSVGVRALDQLLKGEPVNVGTGWFAHADSSTLAPATAARLNAGYSLNEAIKNPTQEVLGMPLTQQFEEARRNPATAVVHEETGKMAPTTLGSLLMINVAEPGTVPFEVASTVIDLAAMIYLDPAAAGLKAVGKSRAAARILVPDGVRKTRLQQNWSSYINAPEQGRTLDYIAGEKNYDRMFGLMRQANPNMPHSIIRRLVDTNPGQREAVKSILEEAHTAKALTRTITPVSVIGRQFGVSSLRTEAAARLAQLGMGKGTPIAEMGGIAVPISQARQRLQLAGAGGVKLAMGDVTRGTYWGRMMADIGTNMVDFGNPERAMGTWHEFLRSLGFGSETNGGYMYRMSAALDNGIDSVFGVANDAIKEWSTIQKARGVDVGALRSFENIFNQQNEIRSYVRNAIGKETWFPGTKTMLNKNGERLPVPTAFSLSQLMDRSIMLPDPRMVRRVFTQANISRFKDATGIPLGRKLRADQITKERMVGYLLDNAMTKFWKPFALLRGAWLVRVVGEEQVRMAGAGLDSMILHPFQLVAMKMGKKMAEDIVGNGFDDLADFKASMTRTGDFRIMRQGRVVYRQTGRWLAQHKGQEGHIRGWWNRLEQIMGDPVQRRLLETDNLDDVKRAFWDGDLKQYRDKLMWDGEHWNLLGTPEGSDAYIEWTNAYKEYMTGGEYIYWRKETNRWYDMADRELPVSDPRIPAQPMPVPRDIPRPSGPETGVIGRGRVLAAPEGWADGTVKLPVGQMLEPTDIDPSIINDNLVEIGGSVRRIRDSLRNRTDPDVVDSNVETINFEIKEIVSRLRRSKVITPDEARTHYRRLRRAKTRLVSDDPEQVRKGVADLDAVLKDTTSATTQRYAAGTGRPMVPGENSLEAVWDVRNKNIHGTVTVGRDADGVPRTIHALTQTGHSSGTVRRLFDQALPEQTGFDLLNLKVWGDDGQLIPLREWLEIRAPGLPPIEDINREQVIDLVDRVTSSMRYPTGRVGRESAAAKAAGVEAANFVADARYHIIRSGNAEMKKGLIDQEMGGVSLRRVGVDVTPDELPETRTITAMLRRNFEDYAPDWTDIPETEAGGIGERWGNMLDMVMGATMGKVTNMFSRSPTFRQLYYNFAGTELFAYMTPTQRAQFIRQALETGVRRPTVRGWLKGLGLKTDDIKAIQAGDITKLGPMPQAPFNTLDEAHEIASAAALTQTRNLLYDVVKRKNIFDSLRLVFPFGDAWAEVLTSWAKLAYQHPQIIRRADQTVRIAQDHGFFYTDPVTGEEVFNYPAQGLLSWLAVGDAKGQGTQLRFTGRVSGLNLATSGFLPGLGPVIQMPISHFGILQDPEAQWARDLLFPYGTPELESPGDWLDQLLPPWMRRFMAGLGARTGETAELFGRTEIDTMRMLMQTGRYDPADPMSREQLVKDATSHTEGLFLVRALGAFFGPTPPAVRFEAEDREGTLWAYTNLGAEFGKMVEAYGGDEQAAFAEFTQRFGLDPSLFTTHKTRSLVRRSVTETGTQFQQRNKTLFERFPLTAYFLYPDDVLDESFEMDGYIQQLRDKTRVGLTTPQWLNERNDFLGRLAYEHARQQTGGRNDYNAINWLRSTRSQLRVEYPGFDATNLGLPDKISRDEVILELEQWAAHPSMKDFAAGLGVQHYLAYREQAKARAIEGGLSPLGFRSADRLRYVRDWLRVQGQGLVAKYPEFSAVWTEVFQREIEEPDVGSDEYLAQLQATTP